MMKKLLAFCFASMMAVAGAAEFDLTVGAEKINQVIPKSHRTNIEVLPAGANGGAIGAELGKFSALQFPVKPDFTLPEGKLEITVMPVVNMSFFKDAKAPQSMTLLQLEWADKTSWHIGAVMAPGYQIMGMAIDGKSNHRLVSSWKKGEKHVLTFQWKNGVVTTAIDGKAVPTTGKAKAAGSPAPRIFYVCGYNNTVFAIQKVSFSEKK